MEWLLFPILRVRTAAEGVSEEALKVDIDGKLVENPYKNWSDIDASLPNKKIEILVAPPTSGTNTQIDWWVF